MAKISLRLISARAVSTGELSSRADLSKLLCASAMVKKHNGSNKFLPALERLSCEHVCPTTHRLPCKWWSLSFTDDDHKTIPDIRVKEMSIKPAQSSVWNLMKSSKGRTSEMFRHFSDILIYQEHNRGVFLAIVADWWLVRSSSQSSAAFHLGESRLYGKKARQRGGREEQTYLWFWFASWAGNSVWRSHFRCPGADSGMLACIKYIIGARVLEFLWDHKNSIFDLM